MRQRKLRWSLLAVTMAMVLAACGDDGATAGGGGDDGGPVKIGVITSLTGRYSALGTFVKNTVSLLADQANAAGGIDGHQVELIFADDQTNPTQAAVALRKLQQENVSAIVGPILSSSCAAILDQVESAGIPMVTTCATESQADPVREHTFMSTLSTPAMAAAVASYLQEAGQSQVAVLHDTTSFGQSGLKALEALAADGTIEIVAQQSYELEATTFVPQLTQLGRSDAKALVVWGAGAPTVTIAKEYQQLGAKIPLVFSAAAATPLFLKPAGDAAEGVVMASSIANVIDEVPDSNPSKPVVTKLAADYEAEYGEKMSQFTADACGAWRVISSAIAEAGTDPAAIRDAIESNEVVGCHGTYQYSATDHHGIAASEVWVVVSKGGNLTATDFSRQQAAG